MRILKPVGVEIEFDDKQRHLLFNVNVIDIIQEHYGMYIVDVLNSIFTEEKDKQAKAYDIVSYVLSVLVNDEVERHNEENPNDIWKEVPEKYLRRFILHNTNTAIVGHLILQSFNESLPQEQNEDEDPNQTSGQTIN